MISTFISSKLIGCDMLQFPVHLVSLGACFVPDFALLFNAYAKYMGIGYNQMIKYFYKKIRQRAITLNVKSLSCDNVFGEQEKGEKRASN